MARGYFRFGCAVAVWCLWSLCRPAVAQEVQVKPWFLVIVDTSTSMNDSTSANSCGYASTKLGGARCALFKLMNSVGDATFGLMQFYRNASCVGVSCGTCTAASCGMMLANIQEDNQNSIISLVDNAGGCGQELYVGGTSYTPLQGALTLARDYFCQNSPGASPACDSNQPPSPYNVSPTGTDQYAACRPMSVILLTDGDETCGGTPPNAATNLRTTKIPVPTSVDSSGYITKDIRTYVIGFGYSPCDYSTNGIEEIATAGGTDAPGTCRGYYASNETELSLAFSQIIADSQLIEKCNGVDDDCDGLTDEGFNVGARCSAGEGACFREGVIECVSEVESECNAKAGAPESESVPEARCRDGVDNDCDGMTDCADPECMGKDICLCVIEEEICDGIDNDCDGLTDEDDQGDALKRTCETACGSGTQVCVNGKYEVCDAPQPKAEECNNKDDDCDGVIDNGNPGGGARCLPEPDGGYRELAEDEKLDGGQNICALGTVTCVAGKYECVGSSSGSPEVCNCLDDDCDGETDEGDLCGGGGICLDCHCVSPCQEAEFACPPGLYCDRSYADAAKKLIGICVPGKCDGVSCADTEVCEPSTGKCEDVCAKVVCEAGQVCVRGSCVEDNCYGLGCPAGQRCRDGQCEKDPCIGKKCGKQEFCRDGECVSACLKPCAAGQICQDGKCVADPCGGACGAGQSCVSGKCVKDSCGECGFGRVCQGAKCVDDPCAGITCPKGTECAEGECAAGGGSTADGGSLGGKPAVTPAQSVVAAGGGGCACSIGRGTAPKDAWGGSGALGLGLGLVGLFMGRRRRKSAVGLAGVISLIALSLAVSVLSGGCKVDAYELVPAQDAGGSVGSGSELEDGAAGSEGGAAGECVPSAKETCNGKDDDCDGKTDEDFDLNTNPAHCGKCNHACLLPHAFPACVKGECAVGSCEAGYHDLNGNPTDGCEYACALSGPEICDGEDNDCDGATDEGIDVNTDVDNCGKCGNSCRVKNGITECKKGKCSLVSCVAGWFDDPDKSGQDCLYACDYAGKEICNGQDDDCNKLIDDGLVTPASFCSHYGVCGNQGVSLVEPVCKGAVGWECDYSSLSDYQANETGCDGLDNDCDNLTDEMYPQIGQDCYSEGIGACRTPGTWQCVDGDKEEEPICADSNNDEVVEGSPGPETANNIDDDCDGLTDEPCNPPTSAGSGCVTDAWAQIQGLTNTYIYAYEASRPDADDKQAGVSNARAVSAANRMPWTNITHGQAEEACAAAGARLCAESEWQTACESGSGGPCTWSYASNCTTYSATTCNGNDYYVGNDKVLPTGSLASCYREHNSARVYDLSGNVKEWVQARGASVNPLRGGAMNNTSTGTSCAFNFTLADDSFLFFNAGFRCCFSN